MYTQTYKNAIWGPRRSNRDILLPEITTTKDKL